MKIQSHHYWKIKFKSKISPKNQSNGRNPKGNQPKAEDRKSASREPQVNRTKLSKNWRCCTTPACAEELQ
jgi:hypothetical protein